MKIEVVTAAVGANVTDIDLAQPLKDDQIKNINLALEQHLVLFFPGQNITPEQQVDFARCFGPINVPAFVPKYSVSDDYIVLDQVSPQGEGADQWHTDNTFMANPPLGSILKAVQLPSVGGDTCFASMFAAYDDLSESMQQMLEGLTATHDITKPLQKALRAGHANLDLASMQEQWPPVSHPVVSTHPKSGRKALFIHRNATTHINELSERENEVLLPFLCDHIRSPMYQCRLHWSTNTLAFWDNRSVQHFAVPDYSERRVMHRVTIDEYK